MPRYFDENGKPTAEAAPFFHFPQGSDIAEPTDAWEARWAAVAAHAPNFDGDLITESLVKEWTVDETVAQALEDDAEAAAYPRDFEDDLNRDMSMNY